jgi:glutathione S-transferase
VEENPLSKVPTLVDDDGVAHIDSLAICLYLDTLGEAPSLAPLNGPKRWPILRRHMLANGILDAAVTRRMESLRTPEPDRLAWMERQLQTTWRVLDRFELLADELGTEAELDTITLACALSYLDFRFADDGWRSGRPRLSKWHAQFEQRPSMLATRFPV